jgi:hypothetical protein
MAARLGVGLVAYLDEAVITVSGVRGSWETLATNSRRIRSTWRNCVMSRDTGRWFSP